MQQYGINNSKLTYKGNNMICSTVLFFNGTYLYKQTLSTYISSLGFSPKMLLISNPMNLANMPLQYLICIAQSKPSLHTPNVVPILPISKPGT